MAFLSGSTVNIPQPEQQPLGLPAERLATNERARPVPLWWGTQRLGCTWLSQAFDQEAEAVESDQKKSNTTIGYNYYASFAGLLGHGPADRIHAIYFDRALVWEDDDNNPTLREDYPDSVSLSIEGLCANWTLYWGTTTQTINPLLATLATGTVVEPEVAEDHPAYRGLCYFVAESQKLGFGRTNVQQVEVVLSRWPTVSWWPVDLAYDIDGDCNPIACIADLLQNPAYGLRLLDSRIDTTALIAVARQLDSEGIGISPIITESSGIRRVLVELCEYFDGYFYSTADGKFSIGLSRPLAYGADIPEVDERHLSRRPEIESGSWDTTSNRVFVNFTNRHVGYTGDSVSADSASNYASTGELSPLVLERRWFTRPEIADWVARHSALWHATPRCRGTIAMRLSTQRELGLDVGSAFKLSYLHLRLNRLYCRVQELRRPDTDSPEVEMEWIAERMKIDGELYTPPTYVAPETPVVEAVNSAEVALLELPWNTVTQDEPTIAFIVARKSRTTDYFRVNRERDAGSFTSLGDLRKFALAKGTLDTSISDTDTSLIIDFDETVINEPLASLNIGSYEIASGKYVVMLRDADGNEELMTLTDASLISATSYTLTIERGKRDTVPLAWTAGDTIWVFAAEGLSLGMREPNSDGDETAFKLQMGAGSKLVAIADVTEKVFTFQQRAARPFAPTDLAVTPLTFTAWQDTSVEWTPRLAYRTDKPRFPGVAWSIQVAASPATGAEDFSEVDSVRYEVDTYTITAAQLTEAFGATPESFDVRVVGKSGSLESLFYESATVTKV